MPRDLSLTEMLFWRSSGSLRIPSSFRREYNITLEEMPDPIAVRVTETKTEVHLTYVFPSSAFVNQPSEKK